MDILTLENMDKSEFLQLTAVKQEDDGESICTEISGKNTAANSMPANEIAIPVCDSVDKQVFKLNRKHFSSLYNLTYRQLHIPHSFVSSNNDHASSFEWFIFEHGLLVLPSALVQFMTFN